MAIILTAEDSPSTRRVIVDSLRAAGHEVLEACDGQEALDLARSRRVDLVITDINMPRMDGLTLVRTLRGESAYAYVPIIVLTTESTTEKKMLGKDAGATAWIVKPFSPEKLNTVVGKVLR